ncbi:MAG: M1 family aminopeptidase [Planctomycetota bacterium]
MTQDVTTGVDHVHRARHGEFTLPGAEAHYPPDLALEPIHLDLDLGVDVDEERLEGTVTHTIRSNDDGATTIRLHAVGFQDVQVADPDGRDVTWGYDGREIHVLWSEAFARGEERRLAVRYVVKRPVTGLFFSRPDEMRPDRPRYAATDHETERARHWLPTIDLPNVRPTLDFHIRAEEGFTILANGILVREETHGDGTKTAHYRLEQPCPSYLTCFTVGDYVRWDGQDFEGREVAAFTTRAFTPADLERSFGRTRAMLAWMAEKLDHPFPYPKYFQFALPGFGGAMENISLVAWDDHFVLDETLAREWTWIVDQVNVHEMAHSYFGDMVVCRDYAHAWLKESWASYVETLWLEDSKGRDEADYDIYTKIDSYAKEADESYKRPIVTRTFNHSWQMYDRHLYPGGASRLHMLRGELGDEAFFRGVRAYLKKFAHRVVETDDFRRAMEEASGRSLGKWFDQWIHGKGYPKIKAAYAYDGRRKEFTITLEQKQVDEKEEIPAFAFTLDVGWVQGGEEHLRAVAVEKAREVVVIPVEKEPEMVRLDPRGRVVMKLEFSPGEDKLLRQLREAKDVGGRILAAVELCRTGKQKHVEALRAAWKEEPFWGVRVRFAEALAKTESEAAVGALSEFIGIEEDPMVLERLLRHAGRIRDRRIRGAILARLERGLPLYRARQAAWEALGAQRDDAPYERLAQVAARPGPDPYALGQVGAFRALAGTRRREALDVLLEHTVPGTTSDRARPAAATAAGQLAHLLEERDRLRTAERLGDLLRDEVPSVGRGALAGLRALGEIRALPALEAYRTRVSAQEQVRVDRVMAAIRKASRPSAPALEKQVDELQTKMRRMEETLARLEARVEGAAGRGGGASPGPSA